MRAFSQQELYTEFLNDIPNIISKSFIESIDEEIYRFQTSLSADSELELKKFKRNLISGNVEDYINLNINLAISKYDELEEEYKNISMRKLDAKLSIPAVLSGAFKYNNQLKSFITLLEPAKGIQKQEKDKNTDCPITFVYKPNYGKELEFIMNESTCRVKTDRVKSHRKNINLSLVDLICAYTGKKSIDVNREVSAIKNTNFCKIEKELNQNEQKKNVLLALTNAVITTSSNIDRMFQQFVEENQYFLMSEVTQKKMEKYFSFSMRCYQTKLLSDLSKINPKLQKGVILDSELLEILDNSNVYELQVEHQKKEFKIIKYPISKYVDSNLLCNLANLISSESEGLNHTQSMDVVINKIGYHCYIFLENYVTTGLYKIIENIKAKLDSKYDKKCDIKSIIYDDVCKAYTFPMFLKELNKSKASIGNCIISKNVRNSIASSVCNYKITSAVKNATQSQREVRISNLFSLDSQASPESEKTGITQQLSCTASFNKDGELGNYFYTINKEGTVDTSEEKFVTVLEYFFKSVKVSDTIALNRGNLIYNTTVFDLVPITSASVSSLGTLSGVYGNADKGRRAQMRANHFEQYLPVLGAQRHYLTSGSTSICKVDILTANDIIDLICNKYEIDPQSVTNRTIRLNNKQIEDNGLQTFTFSCIDPALQNKTIQIKRNYLATCEQNTESYILSYYGDFEQVFWKDEDVVIKPQDIVTNPVDVYYPEDLINLKVPYTGTKDCYSSNREEVRDLVRKYDVGQGKEVRVAYLSWHAHGYEDGCLISQSLYEYMDFAHVSTHTLKVCIGCEIETLQKIVGLYPVNKYYTAEETLFNQKILYKTPTGDTKIKTVKLTVPEHAVGYVTKIVTQPEKNGNYELIITIGELKQLNVGDKFVGHHGNKSIICEILPDFEMPCSEDGVPVDLCIDPLGVPSRMNLGQLEELIGEISNNSVIIVPPYSEENFIANQNLDIKTTCIDLYDNKTLSKLNKKVEVGYAYFMKLDHSVDKKINFIANAKARNRVNNQPIKADNVAGGQTISENVCNYLIADNAPKTLSYLFGVGSDDSVELPAFIKELMETGKTNRIGENKTFDVLLAHLRAIGLKWSGNTETGAMLSIITNSDIKKMAVPIYSKINIESLVEGKIGSGKDDRIQYGYTNYGEAVHWVNPQAVSKEMATLFFYKTEEKISKIKAPTTNFFQEIIYGTRYVKISNESFPDSQEEVPMISSYKTSKEFDKPREGFKTGGVAILYLFETLTKEDLKNQLRYIDECLNVKALDRSLSNADKDIITAMKNVKSQLNNIKELKEYVLNKLLFIPLGLRLSNKELNIQNTFSKILSDTLKRLNSVTKSSGDEKTYNDFYKYVYNYCTSDDAVKIFGKDTKHKAPWTYIKSKDIGDIRSHLLKKKTQFSGRSTIVSDNSVKVNEAHIPLIGIYSVYKYHIVNWLRNDKRTALITNCISNSDLISLIELYAHNSFQIIKRKLGKAKIGTPIISLKNHPKLSEINDNSLEEYIKSAEELYEDNVGEDSNSLIVYKNLREQEYVDKERGIEYTVERIKQDYVYSTNEEVITLGKLIKEVVSEKIQDEIVILIREPALHRQNKQAYHIKMWDRKAIGINTMVCTAYNADFDGDQMAAVFVIPEQCKKECVDNLMFSSLINEDKTGDFNYTLIKDIALGYYSATYKEPDETNIKGKYTSFNQLKEDLDYRIIRLNDTIEFSNAEIEKTINTAGRIITNCMIPNNQGLLKNNKLKFDCPITKSVIKKLQIEGETLSGDDLVNYYSDLQRTGTWFQDLETTSISIRDFMDILENDKIQKALKEESSKSDVEIAKSLGWIHNTISMTKSQDDAFVKNAVKISEEIIDKDSNLYKIFKSGANGSFKSLGEALFKGGYVKSLNDTLLEEPIQNPLIFGLSPHEVLLSGFEVRRAQVSTTHSTKDAGVVTRRLLFLANDKIIEEDDCGIDLINYPKHNIRFKPIKDYQQDFLRENLKKVLSEDSEGYNIFLTRPMDESMLKIFVNNHIQELKFTDGSTFKIEYEITNDCLSQFTNRFGIKLGENEESVLTRTDVLDYVNAGETKIPVRLMYDCKSVRKICKKCFGLDYHKYKHTNCGTKPTPEEFDETKDYSGNFGYAYDEKGDLISSEKILTKNDINLMRKQKVKEIYVSTSNKCLNRNEPCSHCNNKNIKVEELLPDTRTYTGIQSAQTLGEINSQSSMDVKNSNSETATTTSSVAYLRSILNLSTPKEKEEAIFIEENNTIVSMEKSLDDTAIRIVKIKSPTKGRTVEYHIKRNDLTIGFEKDELGNYKERTMMKGDLIRLGRLNYNKLTDLFSLDECQEMLFLDILDVFGRNIEVDTRHIEIIAKTLSENSLITEVPDNCNLTRNVYENTNYLKNIGIDGLKFKPVLTNTDIINQISGPLKTLTGESPAQNLIKVFKNGVKETFTSLYSNILIGKDPTSSKKKDICGYKVPQILPEDKEDIKEDIKKEKEVIINQLINQNSQIVEIEKIFDDEEDEDIEDELSTIDELENTGTTNLFSKH